jgi:hypothetical protein
VHRHQCSVFPLPLQGLKEFQITELKSSIKSRSKLPLMTSETTRIIE